MIEISMKNMCMNQETGDFYAKQLDKAAKFLKGHREQSIPGEYTNWDTWHFPNESINLVSLFVPDSKYIFKSRVQDAINSYKT